MFDITPDNIDSLEKELSEIRFDKIRRNILLDNSSFDVQACPGSGKTTLLASKLILLSKKWVWSKKGVCVLSHTNIAKDEIINRLKNHPTGWKFLKYPHFIGTIQEFVNRFIALPFCHDKGWVVKAIDNDTYYNKCYSKLKHGTRSYLEKHFCSLLDLRLIHCKGKLTINVPCFKKESASNSYINLIETKKFLIANGYYTFREMYDIANANLYNNDFLKNVLRKRFPFVFIDEMQDTAKFQDELLNNLFQNDGDNIVQRFGDSDQAIFDGFNDDDPNETFKGDRCEYRIPDSHRYTPCIANLIRGLSFSSLGLETNCECVNGDNHSECKNYGKNIIFTYSSDDEALLIPELYESHVCDSLSQENDNFISYAVGAIGKPSSKDTHVHIDKYINNYSKSKNSVNPKFASLYECVAYAVLQNHHNAQENFNLIIECILNYVYQTNSKIKLGNETIQVNKSNFITGLRSKLLNFRSFNKIIGKWAIIKALPLNFSWDNDLKRLNEIFTATFTDFPTNITTVSFWCFPSTNDIERWSDPNNFNKISKNNVDIIFDTIHGVKGQTHDATLVLETKYSKSFDVGTLIENFVNEDATKKDNPQNVKFMKQLFVGMSRPRRILCLAVHKDSIKGYEEKLVSIGWKIQPVNN